MAKEKKEQIKGQTPKGIAVWPYLNTPDDVQGKARLAYKTGLRLNPDESAALIEFLTPHVDASYELAVKKLEEAAANGKDGKTKAAAKKSLAALSKVYPWDEDVDSDGEPTGDYIFKFKSNADYEKDGKKHAIRVPLFNGSKPTKVLVGGGSEIKVAYIVVPFHMPATDTAGISLRIDAVKVIKPVAPGSYSQSAEGYFPGDDEEGFEDDDEGFDEDAPGVTNGGSNNTDEDEEF